LRITAIIGSPRRGNTFHAVRAIEDRLLSTCDLDFEYVMLSEAHLEPCRGCFLCLARGEDRCPLKDDRERIEHLMLGSDGVILASPVYAMNVSWLMKLFMDRLAYTLHRPRFFGQRVLLVATTGAVGLKETLNQLEVMRYAGFRLAKKVGISAPVTPEGQQAALAGLRSAADDFRRAVLDRGLPIPSLTEVMTFEIQRSVFALLEDCHPCDYEYFSRRGWFEPARRFYVDARVSPWKHILARLLAARIRRRMEKELRQAGACKSPGFVWDFLSRR
jgi:NAD(P)H-dependent FMN reductase